MDAKDIEQYKKALMKIYTKRTPEDHSISDISQRANETIQRTERTKTSAEETRLQSRRENVNTAESLRNEADSLSENNENSDTDTSANVTDSDSVTKNTENENNEEHKEYDDENYDDGEHDSAYFPYTGDVETETIDGVYPEPDLSEFRYEPLSGIVSEENLGNSTGYILVNVRTGREGAPIGGASVVVTAVSDGNRFFIAAGYTDISGTTLKLETPAPDEAYSQIPDSKVRPYSLFDISVKANGYFNARSVDVPVFSGITSIQNFNMIPVPLLMRSDDETLTYFNQEPNFG